MLRSPGQWLEGLRDCLFHDVLHTAVQACLPLRACSHRDWVMRAGRNNWERSWLLTACNRGGVAQVR